MIGDFLSFSGSINASSAQPVVSNTGVMPDPTAPAASQPTALLNPSAIAKALNGGNLFQTGPVGVTRAIGAGAAPVGASAQGSISTTEMLIIAGAVLVGFMFLKRKGGSFR